MSELGTEGTGTLPPVVQFAPPDIARRRIATWNRIQTDAVEVVRRAPFEYGFRPSRHLLIVCERDEGETVVEGLPKSTVHELSRTMSFVPAGHRFSGWQKPRTLARVLRFQRFLGAARSPNPGGRDLARLAAETGYADQAHLTRDSRRLTGLPPAALLDWEARRATPAAEGQPAARVA